MGIQTAAVRRIVVPEAIYKATGARIHWEVAYRPSSGSRAVRCLCVWANDTTEARAIATDSLMRRHSGAQIIGISEIIT